MMKLARAVIFACLMALSAFPAFAACTNDDPSAAAKSFYSKHHWFASEDPAKIRTIITSRLFDALNQEFKCAQGQICAIESDPWTGAQDGKVGTPVEFATVSSSGAEAIVSMSFPFILDKTHHEQRRVTILLQRASPTDCWLISDLVGPRGDSLVQNLEAWYKEYGSAL